jgi:hypothetical protein
MPLPRRKRSITLDGIVPSFLVGCLLVWIGWYAMGRFRTVSLEQLIFADGSSNRGWTVVLLFRPKECPSRMELVERLNRLKSTGITVQGLLLSDTLDFLNWRDLIIANRISFPVRPISPTRANAALAHLEGLPSPVLVVFDPERRLRVATDFASEAALDALPLQIAAESRAATPTPTADRNP